MWYIISKSIVAEGFKTKEEAEIYMLKNALDENEDEQFYAEEDDDEDE